MGLEGLDIGDGVIACIGTAVGAIAIDLAAATTSSAIAVTLEALAVDVAPVGAIRPTRTNTTSWH